MILTPGLMMLGKEDRESIAPTIAKWVAESRGQASVQTPCMSYTVKSLRCFEESSVIWVDRAHSMTLFRVRITLFWRSLIGAGRSGAMKSAKGFLSIPRTNSGSCGLCSATVLMLATPSLAAGIFPSHLGTHCWTGSLALSTVQRESTCLPQSQTIVP